MNPKLTTHELIKTPMMELTAKHWAYGPEKDPHVGLNLWLWAMSQHGHTLYACTEKGTVPPDELLALADQFQIAAIQLRALAAEIDPGRRFEADQAQAFGVDRLEDGEVASEP